MRIRGRGPGNPSSRVRRVRQGYSDPTWRCPPDLAEHFEQVANRIALPHQRAVQTAHAVRSASAETAALLEQRAELSGSQGTSISQPK